jgi:hypothetical protein
MVYRFVNMAQFVLGRSKVVLFVVLVLAALGLHSYLVAQSTWASGDEKFVSREVSVAAHGAFDLLAPSGGGREWRNRPEVTS